MPDKPLTTTSEKKQYHLRSIKIVRKNNPTLMKSSNQKPHFNLGIRKDVAFIFSCPGQEEAINKKPTSGKLEITDELFRYFSK
ncbi:MAG: hypothetical protein IPG89_15320 [Bacteroidetes bacterium]|nr:hypothetical protein [Bacteroidota bacterium]